MSTNDISLGTGLGTLGLSSPGMYSSYAGIAPYSLSFGGLGSLGTMGALGTMGTMGYNPMLMGMYNPVYYSQLMNQMETNQAHHSADMQALTLRNELRAYQNTDNATINKIDNFRNTVKAYALSLKDNTKEQKEQQEEKKENQVKGPAEPEVKFGIQIMAINHTLDKNSREFKGYKAKYFKSGKYYKYYIGEYSSREEAQKALPKIRRTFPEAFIIKLEQK